MDFSTSTHKNFWIFSKEEIKGMRERVNNLEVNKKNENERHLSMKEENLIRVYFERTFIKRLIDEVFKNFNNNRTLCKIKSTTIAFFKRFYLFHSVIDFDPVLILKVCLRMAFKVEDQEIDINKILADISPENNEKYSPEKILDIEMFVIDALKYHLIIFSPFRSLTGLEFEISEKIKRPVEKEIIKVAEDLIEGILFTDGVFYFTPAQIAMFALARAATIKKNADIPELVARMYNAADESQPKFEEIAKEIFELLKESLSTNSEVKLIKKEHPLILKLNQLISEREQQKLERDDEMIVDSNNNGNNDINEDDELLSAD